MKAEIHTTLDGDLLRKARRMARERKVAVSAILERALDRYLDQLAGEQIEQDETHDGGL
jgi:post-segregation antitoxin (ccd killing protein)